MFPSSLAVVLTGLGLGIFALAGFAWGWRSGLFDDLRAQSLVIFEPRDLRLERPWESPAQRDAREWRYGELEPPEPGEWGGGAR